jgi:photosystem II stability/assembly factor-like uncharacterized protein
MRYKFLVLTILLVHVCSAQDIWEPINNPAGQVYTIFYTHGSLYIGNTAGNIYRSSDKGITWENMGKPATTSITAIVYCNGLIFAAAADGIYKTSTDGLWEKVSLRTTSSIITRYDNLTGKYNIISAGTAGIFKSEDDGLNWSPLFTSESVKELSANPDGVITALSNDKIYRSVNEGLSWELVYQGYPNNINYSVCVTGDYEIYAAFGKIIRSTDYGITWVTLDNSQYYRQITTDKKNNLYAFDMNSYLSFSNDKGTSWKNIRAGLPIYTKIFSLYIDDNGNGFCSMEGSKLFRSFNFFVPACSILLPSNFSNNISIKPTLAWKNLPGVSKYFYQLSTSTSFADSTVIQEGFVHDTTITVGPLKGNTQYHWRIYAQNEFGRGLWTNVYRFKTGTVTSVNDIPPPEFHLSQNYPNPFNPETIITFSLPEAGDVVLKVYDITGKEVKTMINNYMHAGRYRIDFNGKGLSSGIYFYSISAGKYNSIKKMQMIK